MFGLSMREVLMKAILNASKNKIEIYKQGIKSNMDVLNVDLEGDVEEKEVFMSVRREYLDEVANSVINTFDVSSPIIASRIKLEIMFPSIDINDGILAGSLYAICYHAINNKDAKPKDCIRLNHLQNDIMNVALAELDSEYSK